MPRFLKVKNFERFQHYKDRNPLWIKLYYELLDNYDFACLPDATKLHLVMIWLLASRHQNRVPADPEWLERRIHATEPIRIDLLISSGFLEDCTAASDLLADCKQSATPETEREIEKETPARPAGARAGAAKRPVSPDGDEVLPGFSTWWKEYPAHGTRKRGRSKCLRFWKRNKLELIAEKVIGAMRRCKASYDWTKQGGQFIQGPEPWLNDTPWETDAAELVVADPISSNGDGEARDMTPEEYAAYHGDED